MELPQLEVPFVGTSLTWTTVTVPPHAFDVTTVDGSGGGTCAKH